MIHSLFLLLSFVICYSLCLFIDSHSHSWLEQLPYTITNKTFTFTIENIKHYSKLQEEDEEDNKPKLKYWEHLNQARVEIEKELRKTKNYTLSLINIISDKHKQWNSFLFRKSKYTILILIIKKFEHT